MAQHQQLTMYQKVLALTVSTAAHQIELLKNSTFAKKHLKQKIFFSQKFECVSFTTLKLAKNKNFIRNIKILRLTSIINF